MLLVASAVKQMYSGSLTPVQDERRSCDVTWRVDEREMIEDSLVRRLTWAVVNALRSMIEDRSVPVSNDVLLRRPPAKPTLRLKSSMRALPSSVTVSTIADVLLWGGRVQNEPEEDLIYGESHWKAQGSEPQLDVRRCA